MDPFMKLPAVDFIPNELQKLAGQKIRNPDEMTVLELGA
jgi:hypothetical protein